MANTKGISASGDVLVNETADGVKLNDLWAEIEKALALYNQQRSTIVRLLSYPTIAVADIIPQSVEGESFEIATEFGVPTALREPADYLRLGYNFQDYDKRLGATWKWLRAATAEQVAAQVTRIFEADNRLVSGTILRRLLDPAPRSNEWQHMCYGLWSGDGMVPPDYLGQTFDNTHTHYLTSGSANIDSADVEDMIRHVTEHGYGRFGGQGGQLIILAHPNEVEDMTFWRAGVEYATGKKPKWDFVPSAAQPAYLATRHPRSKPPNILCTTGIDGARADHAAVEGVTRVYRTQAFAGPRLHTAEGSPTAEKAGAHTGQHCAGKGPQSLLGADDDPAEDRLAGPRRGAASRTDTGAPTQPCGGSSPRALGAPDQSRSAGAGIGTASPPSDTDTARATTFAADAPPAASADDALRRSLRCECRSDLVSQRSDHRDRQPGRLVFGLRRIAATDTSNPNQSYTPGSTNCTFSTSPALDCGWIPTAPVRTDGTQLHATLVTGG